MSYFLLYDGPSEINGERVGVVAYLGSRNKKTQGMVETYILVAECEPNEAANRGLDVAVCGGCPKRRSLARTARERAKKEGRKDPVPNCYVNLCYGPRTAYEAWMRGDAQPCDISVLSMLAPIRMGTYGDPAAVPFEVWAPLLDSPLARWTGYTHQWASPRTDERFKSLCMASVDTPEQYEKAKAATWRTFRVRPWQDGEHTPALSGEKTCPASKEAGQKTTCQMCQLCTGTSATGPDITTMDHGHSTRHVWKVWLENKAKEAEQAQNAPAQNA